MPASSTDSEGHLHLAPKTPLPLTIATAVICALVLALPLMMGQRTPETLTATLLTLVFGSLMAAGLAIGSGHMRLPERGWLWFAGLFTTLVILQVLPSMTLARWFGPYPDALWAHPEFNPTHWSPDPGATLRAWAAFVALFAIAWMGHSLPRRLRYWILMAIAGMGLFQALYGLLAHAAGAEYVLGLWERNSTNFVNGTYSNRNLYAAYLALTWPLAVGIWWIRKVPLLGRLPRELKVTGSILCGSIIGAAMMGSVSRLGASAGIFGMLLTLVLWARHRRIIDGAAIWPAYLAATGAVIAAIWYGLTPLAERLLATTGEEVRLEVFAIMLWEFPARWHLHGVGLGGFEAAFRPFQPGHISGWFDYAHNDALQWLIETGVPGILLAGSVVVALLRRGRLTTERISLYAGLAAMCLVALGDFSWHIPGTQVVLAFFVGVLLR